MATINVKTSLTQNGCTLDTLELSIRFHSAIPSRDVPECVPVEVSICLSDEWASFLPIVQVSKERLANKSLTPAMFPFLPLPPHFEPINTSQWQQLTQQIEDCLVADPSLDSKHPTCYRLMRELFWMSFVAAHPEFPYGDWPRWNTAIAMEGDFISRWMLKDEDEQGIAMLKTPLQVQLIVWEQFRSVTSDALLLPVNT